MAAMAASSTADTSASTKRARIDTSQYPTSPEFLATMVHAKVDRFFKAGDVIFTATRENLVIDVWKGMVERGFHSVPVLLHSEHRYFGFLTLADIVGEVVKRFNKESLRDSKSFWDRMDESKLFGQLTVGDIMSTPLSYRNPFHPVGAGYSLLYAIEMMAREDALERIPVLDSRRNLVNIITQSKLIAYISEHLDILGEKGGKPLRLCHEMHKPVVSATQDTLAVEAFDRLVQNNVGGLAVVDETGKLVDTLSMSDIKACGSSLTHFWRFYQPLSTYLNELKTEHKRVSNVVVVTGDHTLGQAIDLLASNRLHRLFIVDSLDHMKVIGVVALRDILGEIMAA